MSFHFCRSRGNFYASIKIPVPVRKTLKYLKRFFQVHPSLTSPFQSVSLALLLTSRTHFIAERLSNQVLVVFNPRENNPVSSEEETDAYWSKNE